jgi:hypothetical protein
MHVIELINDSSGIISVSCINCADKVKIEEVVYNELMAMGVSPIWLYRQGKVYCRMNNRQVSIARLIVDAGRNQLVKFIDKNPLNLTLDNLVVTDGAAKFAARNDIATPFPPPRFEYRNITKELEL